MTSDLPSDPSKIVIEFSCLRARQPIGEIFVGTISHTELAKMTFFDVRRRIQVDRDVERYLGVQRPLDERRVKQLQEYVTYIDAAFPSSIIIALPEEYVSFDEDAGKMQVRNYRDQEQVFASVPLKDTDLTTENFVPGSSGEAKFRRILRREEGLQRDMLGDLN